MMLTSPFSRSKGDPSLIESGPSSLHSIDRVAKFLGWFSIGLGLTEVFAPNRLSRLLGMESDLAPTLVRSYGAREIGAGILTLSVDKQVGLYARVLGDVADIATLVGLVGRSNPKRGAAKFALAAVLGITALDVCAANALRARSRSISQPKRYTDRTGFPRGLKSVRGGKATESPASRASMPVS
jgi:hypothetical protein